MCIRDRCIFHINDTHPGLAIPELIRLLIDQEGLSWEMAQRITYRCMAYTNGKTDIYLQLGSSGSQVKILQKRLIVLGYLSGTADGEFAETTQAAVIAFQERNSIYACLLYTSRCV